MVGGNGSHVVAGRAHVGAGVLLPHHRDLECRALRVNTTLTEKITVLKKTEIRQIGTKLRSFCQFLQSLVKLNLIGDLLMLRIL